MSIVSYRLSRSYSAPLFFLFFLNFERQVSFKEVRLLPPVFELHLSVDFDALWINRFVQIEAFIFSTSALLFSVNNRGLVKRDVLSLLILKLFVNDWVLSALYVNCFIQIQPYIFTTSSCFAKYDKSHIKKHVLFLLILNDISRGN